MFTQEEVVGVDVVAEIEDPLSISFLGLASDYSFTGFELTAQQRNFIDASRAIRVSIRHATCTCWTKCLCANDQVSQAQQLQC